MSIDMSLVTIAIPTLNRSEFLRLSVESALLQTYSNIEILVSDNASEDETPAVLANFGDKRLRTLRQESRVTMFANWNSVLRAARGEYFLLLSDDDLLEPFAIETMLEQFKATPAVGLVCCRGMIIDSHGRELIPGKMTASRLTAEEMIAGFFRSELDLWPCSLMFRRTDIGEYSERFPLGADAALWIKLVTKYGVAAFIPKVLTRYRVHANTTAKTQLDKWYAENLQLAEYAIERLQEYGYGNSDFFDQIRTAAKRLNVRITGGFIVTSWGRSRWASIVLFRQHAGRFASGYGILVFIKCVIAVSLSRGLMLKLVPLSRIVKQKLSFSLDRTQNG
jgi:glycosyltransferase involved in cell wall biosynthesis